MRHGEDRGDWDWRLCDNGIPSGRLSGAFLAFLDDHDDDAEDEGCDEDGGDSDA